MKRLLLLLLLLLAACEIDVAPVGLRLTPAGAGPVVRFDPVRDVPLPSDVATAPDPTSRTGRRPSLSLAGKTSLERQMRVDLDAMEGWGVSAPITVSFDRSATTDVRMPAIDVDAVLSRMATDEHDPANDPFYVVNLVTGIPALLDVGNGYSPQSVRDPFRYGPNDVKASEPNLVFETTEEGADLPFFAYTPEHDHDFDGVLDHPNIHDWYERQTDTLILRPIVPLAEMTEYAVVLTDRLRAPNGEPVRSPFEAIHHPTQRASIARLRDWLTDNRLASYYGDIAGTGLDHVAFAWTFTTQPTRTDLRLLRDGLHGEGPFERLSRDFPAELKVANISSGECATMPVPTILKLDDPSIVSTFLQQREPLAPGGVAALNASLAHIDHIVVGSFRSPYLLGDPAANDPNARFAIEYLHGVGAIGADEVQWVLVVPKAKAARTAPFPVAIWGHSDKGHAEEALVYGGDFARQGVALLAYNQPGHGLVLDEEQRQTTQRLFADHCVAPLFDALTGGRAHGTDGAPPWWTGHVAHDRDMIRQGALDGINLVRILSASTDATRDFDHDGTPDIGGSYFAAGPSLTTSLLGASEPLITATVPIASGGGLATDIALRSVTTAPNASVLGPWVFAVPVNERADSTCTASQRSVRFGSDAETELACLDATELGVNVTVVVTNVTAGIVRCATTAQDGRFAIPIPTSAGDRLDVQVYDAPDVVATFATCTVKRGAPIGRRIQTFERKIPGHEIDDRLRATADGLGLRRQSPELRRFRDLAQALLDPADPVAFASLFMLDPAAEPRALLASATVGDAAMPISSQLAFARAAGALPFLPPASAERLPAYADYATPRDFYDRLGQRTPMRFLVESGTAEGIARFGRTSGGPACRANSTPDRMLCPIVPTDAYACATALFDPDWSSEGALPFDQPHPDVPLRLARLAKLHTTDATTLAASWEPRLTGVPFAPDSAGWTATAQVVALWTQYVEPQGAHAWSTSDTCRSWDPAAYGNALIARFLATNGRDLYYLSHPNTHGCLASGTCDLFQ